MKKYVLKTIFILTAILLFCCGMVSAAYAETDGDWEYRKVKPSFRPFTEKDYKAMITGYHGSETDLAFPTNIGGLEVNGIDDSAFQDNSRIESVTIPYYEFGVGDYAFENCSKLKEIHFTSVHSCKMGVGAFENCTALKKLSSYSTVYGADDPDNSYVQHSSFRNAGSASGGFVYTYRGSDSNGIADNAFEESYIKEVTFEKGAIDYIGNEAFKKCKVLETVSLGEECTYVGKDAFKGCDSLKIVNYYSSSSKWKKITIKSGNQDLKDAKRYYRLQTPVVRVINKSTGVQLTWYEVPNAKEYKIYRKADGGKYKLVKTATKSTATSYLDKIVKDKSGTKYTYKVVAVNGFRKSAFEEKVIMRMGKPTVKLKEVDEGIQINWTKVKGADGYIIREKSTMSKSEQQIARVESGDTITFTHKIDCKGYGTKYSYTVTPYYGCSNENGSESYVNLGVESGAKYKRTYNNSSNPERASMYYVKFVAGVLPEGSINRPTINRSDNLTSVVGEFQGVYADQAGYDMAYPLFSANLSSSQPKPWTEDEKLIKTSVNHNNSRIARPIQHVDGRFGIQIRAWRDNQTIIFDSYNYLLDYFCYLAGGDEEVGFAFWKCIDTYAMKGKTDSIDFGFVGAGKNKIKMNGVTIEYKKAPGNLGQDGGYYFFFSY